MLLPRFGLITPIIRLRGTSSILRRYGSKSLAPTVEVDGKKYDTDPEWTNITTSIANLTGRSLHLQETHPISILREIVESKLKSINNNQFKIYNDFRPVVTKHENFDSLGFPDDHPGRSKSDTYYINKDHLLRTHTSAHEMQCFSALKNDKQDKGFLISADVYRRDEIDRTHYPAFHQMEGAQIWTRDTDSNKDPTQLSHIKQMQNDIKHYEELLKQYKTKVIVEDDVSLDGNPKQAYMTDLEVDLCQQHLKRSLELVVAEVFTQKIFSMQRQQETTQDKVEIPKDLKLRWIKAYFPWTAPSWEIEVWWQGEWLEICGCGLVQQQVLINSGYQKDTTFGWAFGLGLDRIAMLLFEVPDIRLFWTQDERFHSQFTKGVISPFTAYSKYPGTVRDVAFWLPKTKELHLHENDVMEIVRSVAEDLVESVQLIDEFVNPKTTEKSLCYRVNYQSMDRNITNEEVNNLQEQVRQELVNKFDVKLR